MKSNSKNVHPYAGVNLKKEPSEYIYDNVDIKWG